MCLPLSGTTLGRYLWGYRIMLPGSLVCSATHLKDEKTTQCVMSPFVNHVQAMLVKISMMVMVFDGVFLSCFICIGTNFYTPYPLYLILGKLWQTGCIEFGFRGDPLLHNLWIVSISCEDGICKPTCKRSTMYVYIFPSLRLVAFSKADT